MASLEGANNVEYNRSSKVERVLRAAIASGVLSEESPLVMFLDVDRYVRNIRSLKQGESGERVTWVSCILEESLGLKGAE
jgi:hypothetical protein